MKLTPKLEHSIIQLGILLYWTLFWLFNSIDKFIGGPTFLFVGKDRLTQFVEYFTSIGIENEAVAFWFLAIVTALQVVAFAFGLMALILFLSKRFKMAHKFFFFCTLLGLIIFSFFAVGDQIFGDRFELLEHTIYWIALVISWMVFAYFPRISKR